MSRIIDFSKEHKYIFLLITEVVLIILSALLFFVAVSAKMLSNGLRHSIGVTSIYIGFSVIDLLIVTLLFSIIGYPILYSDDKKRFANNTEIDKIYSQIHDQLWKININFSVYGLGGYVSKWKNIIIDLQNRVTKEELSIMCLIIDMKNAQFNPLSIMGKFLKNILLMGPIFAVIAGYAFSFFGEIISDVMAHAGWALQSNHNHNFANTLTYFLWIGYVGEVIIVFLITYLKNQHEKQIMKILQDIFKFAAK